MLSILLAGLFLYLALRNLDWTIFFYTLKNAHYAYLPIIILWGSLSHWVRALRLRVLLSAEKKLPVSNVFFANMAGYLGNSIFPARAGELIRTMYIARKDSISISFVFAVGLVERLMDLVILIMLGSFALLSVEMVSPAFQNALKVISIFGLIGLTAVFVTPRFSTLIDGIITSLPLIQENYKLKLKQFSQQFLHGLSSLHSFNRVIQFMGLTLLIWLMDALGMILLSYVLNMLFFLQEAFVLLAGLGISSAIPSTPGYVGVYQFVAVTVLGSFNFSNADSLAYILVVQIINYLVVGFWGIISILRFNKEEKI